jgi:hypothetical protein
MANSVFQDPFGIDWPLGYLNVASPGTPVGVMSLVDTNNNNAPETFTKAGCAEYTPRCHRVRFSGFHPTANGMVMNSGFVYILRSSGVPGNRSDSGAMVQVLLPGGTVDIPAAETEGATISPYRYQIDADNAGEGAQVVLLGCSR